MSDDCNLLSVEAVFLAERNCLHRARNANEVAFGTDGGERRTCGDGYRFGTVSKDDHVWVLDNDLSAEIEGTGIVVSAVKADGLRNVRQGNMLLPGTGNRSDQCEAKQGGGFHKHEYFTIIFALRHITQVGNCPGRTCDDIMEA